MAAVEIEEQDGDRAKLHKNITSGITPRLGYAATTIQLHLPTLTVVDRITRCPAKWPIGDSGAQLSTNLWFKSHKTTTTTTTTTTVVVDYNNIFTHTSIILNRVTVNINYQGQ